MFAVLSDDGRVLGSYSREDTAKLNSEGRRVKPLPTSGPPSAHLRYHEGRWLDRPPAPPPEAPYGTRRAQAYAEKLHLDRQLEAFVEGLVELFGDRPLPPKLAALLSEIDEVKQDHPKGT